MKTGCTWQVLLVLQPNDTWQSGCQMCECDSETLRVLCQPVTCPVSPSVTCDKPGQVLVNTTIDCCEIYECSKWSEHKKGWGHKHFKADASISANNN